VHDQLGHGLSTRLRLLALEVLQGAFAELPWGGAWIRHLVLTVEVEARRCVRAGELDVPRQLGLRRVEQLRLPGLGQLDLEDPRREQNRARPLAALLGGFFRRLGGVFGLLALRRRIDLDAVVFLVVLGEDGAGKEKQPEHPLQHCGVDSTPPVHSSEARKDDAGRRYDAGS
jgi:hypothetical protein